MKYALCCLLFFAIISCKQDEVIGPDEEEVLFTDENEKDSGFPLILSIDETIPSEHTLSSIKIHPSEDGGVFLLGEGAGIGISSEAQVKWTYDRRGDYDVNKKEVFTHEIANGKIKVFQINDQGEPQLLFDFSHDHNIDLSSRMIQIESSIYFYWRTGKPGNERILNIVSLDLEGQLIWKKEFDFDDYIYPNIVAHNDLLFVQFGNNDHVNRVDGVSVAIINESGDVIRDFELTTNLDEWNKSQPLVEIQVDDDYVYSNTTKRDNGLFRRSRIAKYSYEGELVDEVEIPYSKDFYIEDKKIYAIGNGYEIDPDIRRGHPFVIKLDKNLNVIHNKTFDNIETSWVQLTVSDNIIYVHTLLSSLISSSLDSLYLDTLTFK